MLKENGLMNNENETERLPAPSITRSGEGEESLDVESLDMDKSGRQGQVLVSKGEAGSSVSKLHAAAAQKRRVTRP
jgi:hypothetical protein